MATTTDSHPVAGVSVPAVPHAGTPCPDDGQVRYSHSMSASGVALVGRREIDLVRVASATCCAVR
jgi:hypothetical protein